METFSINIFYDKNLFQHLLLGWNENHLIEGKVRTLTGRTIVLDGLSNSTTVNRVKELIEDKEGFQKELMELRKGKRTLKDEETLEQAFVVKGNTLLLLMNYPLEFERSKQDDQPSMFSTKLRTAPLISKTVVVDPEEAKKEDVKNWWEKGNSSSGPQQAGPSTSATTTVGNISGPKAAVNEIPIPPQSSERTSEEEESRRKRLEAIELRYGKKSSS
eukprot:TRINITY_DN1366_c0_g1_i2.p2 TRINITY_DN1366_c0_g1~~TRINITY_DN1366_c0_g1_i2.p2  ORF type:complete len:217 (-),score=33.78 TRINITY_DN1366_c0_g1_i2:1240-1890(-)